MRSVRPFEQRIRNFLFLSLPHDSMSTPNFVILFNQWPFATLVLWQSFKVWRHAILALPRRKWADILYTHRINMVSLPYTDHGIQVQLNNFMMYYSKSHPAHGQEVNPNSVSNYNSANLLRMYGTIESSS